MQQILLVLNFLVPGLVFSLGKYMKEKGKRFPVKESVLLLLLSLILSPVLQFYFSLTVQAFMSAVLLFVQFLFFAMFFYKREKNKI